jgi:hypothetical protein
VIFSQTNEAVLLEVIPMSTEKVVFAKLQRLPEPERDRLLRMIDAWIEQNVPAHTLDTQKAVAAVGSTWGTFSLDGATLRWVAEDKELESEAG